MEVSRGFLLMELSLSKISWYKIWRLILVANFKENFFAVLCPYEIPSGFWVIFEKPENPVLSCMEVSRGFLLMELSRSKISWKKIWRLILVANFKENFFAVLCPYEIPSGFWVIFEKPENPCTTRYDLTMFVTVWRFGGFQNRQTFGFYKWKKSLSLFFFFFEKKWENRQTVKPSNRIYDLPLGSPWFYTPF